MQACCPTTHDQQHIHKTKASTFQRVVAFFISTESEEMAMNEKDAFEFEEDQIQIFICVKRFIAITTLTCAIIRQW